MPFRPSRAADPSLNQHPVQLIEQRLEPVPEELVGAAEAALLGEGQALQIVGGDFDASADVFSDGGQPLDLIVVEIGAVGMLLGDPVFEALADGFREGFELPFLADGEFHQGDDVGEDALF